MVIWLFLFVLKVIDRVDSIVLITFVMERGNWMKGIRLKSWFVFSLIFVSMLTMGAESLFAATDVTDKVQINKSRMRVDRRTSENYFDASLTNISDDILLAPIKVVIDSISTDTVTVVNADGVTEDGRSYFEYASGSFSPADTTTTKKWVFANPTRARFNFTHKVYDFSVEFIDEDGDGVSPEQGDCDDSRADVYPGTKDIPNNGVDEDCDGSDLVDLTLLDQDGDGFSPVDGDCNDGDNEISPDAFEICDNIDNNCDGRVDSECLDAVQEIGQEGGAVEVYDPASLLFGIVVEIEEGTFAANEIVSIAVQENPPITPLPEGLVQEGPCISFEATNIDFQKPVTIKLPFDGEKQENEIRVVYTFNEHKNQWELVVPEPTADPNVFVAVVNHFSDYVKGTATITTSSIETSFEIGRDTMLFQNGRGPDDKQVMDSINCPYTHGICGGLGLLSAYYFNELAEDESLALMDRWGLETSARASCETYSVYERLAGVDLWEIVGEKVHDYIHRATMDYTYIVDAVKENARHNIVTPIFLWKDGVGHSVIAYGWERQLSDDGFIKEAGKIKIYNVNYNDYADEFIRYTTSITTLLSYGSWEAFSLDSSTHHLNFSQVIAGYPVISPDDDIDGVINQNDLCGNSPQGRYVDQYGCAFAELIPPQEPLTSPVQNAIVEVPERTFSWPAFIHPENLQVEYCLVVNDRGTDLSNRVDDFEVYNTCSESNSEYEYFSSTTKTIPAEALQYYNSYYTSIIGEFQHNHNYTWTVFVRYDHGKPNYYPHFDWTNFSTELEPFPYFGNEFNVETSGNESVYALIRNLQDVTIPADNDGYRFLKNNANSNGYIQQASDERFISYWLDSYWFDELSQTICKFNTVYDQNSGTGADGIFEVVSAGDEEGSSRGTTNENVYYFSYDALNDGAASDSVTLTQWVDYLAAIKDAYQSIGRLTIFTHGNYGRFWLSDNIELSLETVNNPNHEHHQQLIRLKDEGILTNDAHVLLFSCLVAGSPDGEALVQKIAELTGAYIHANSEYTGNASSDADLWIRYHVGDVGTDWDLNIFCDQNGCINKASYSMLDLPLNETTNIEPDNINFIWKPVDNFSEYCFNIFEDGNSGSPIYYCGLSTHAFQTSLQYGKTYYWAAEAKDGNGTTLEASEWWSLTTSADPNDLDLDGDSDEVPNNFDLCPNTPITEVADVDATGCSPSQRDTDGDEVSDNIDLCPGTPSEDVVDASGCTIVDPLDSDNDGVFDDDDLCPNTPITEIADTTGCSVSQRDTDNDGVNDSIDLCAGTPPGDVVDATGCTLTGVPIPEMLSADYDESRCWNYITWTDVGADEYNLYWGTEDAVETDSQLAEPTTTTDYGHSGVVPGSTYFYRVQAKFADGTLSGLSNTMQADVDINVSRSCPPKNVQAQYQPSLGWNYITWDNVPNATEYYVYWGTETGVTTGSEELEPTITTTYAHTGVLPDWMYCYRVASVVEDVESGLSAEVCAVVRNFSPLNDTGMTWGGDYPSGNNPGCTGTEIDAQDCSHGRDVTHNDDSDGHAGFSFTKLDSSGNPLSADVANWSCVQDNVTGLIWEMKTNYSGPHDKDDRYTWYNTDPATNGGAVGYADYRGNVCHGYDSGNPSSFCNTQNYVAKVNAAGWCGASDWRMPTRKELQGLVSYDRYNSALDTDYFPNIVTSFVWSGTPTSINSDSAWSVNFSNGESLFNYRDYGFRVRLVRDGQ